MGHLVVLLQKLYAGDCILGIISTNYKPIDNDRRQEQSQLKIQLRLSTSYGFLNRLQ